MKTFWKPETGNHLVVTCPCCRTRFNEDLDEHSDYFNENPRAVVSYLQTFHKFCGACGQQLIKETGSATRASEHLKEFMDSADSDKSYESYLEWVVDNYKPNSWNIVLSAEEFENGGT